jgi:hypothetical protein
MKGIRVDGLGLMKDIPRMKSFLQASAGRC